MMKPFRRIIAGIGAFALAACIQGNPPAAPDTASVPDHHNARNALDWPGMYVGTLPCASCSGIRTALTLHGNGEYRLRETYLGNPESVFDSRGTFSWNEAGNTVTLSGSEPRRYFVAENQLFALDADGKRISGALAEAYILHKPINQTY
ncbi:MAG: copper resistance protein NlpE [Neisseria sp.]|nr:copper resistance protein NlpE [Neisseria sp.]